MVEEVIRWEVDMAMVGTIVDVDMDVVVLVIMDVEIVVDVVVGDTNHANPFPVGAVASFVAPLIILRTAAPIEVVVVLMVVLMVVSTMVETTTTTTLTLHPHLSDHHLGLTILSTIMTLYLQNPYSTSQLT